MLKQALLTLTGLMLCSCCLAAGFTSGERSQKLYNDELNPAKNNVHLVVVQKIDMSEILTEEAYGKLKAHERVRYNRFEFNETKANIAERCTTIDGAGRIIKDINSFTKDNKWYSIDYINKTYDELPELPGMVHSLRETFDPYFVDNMPEGGFDDFTGYDYDRRYKSDKEIYFYFEKDTSEFKGYEISGTPRFNVMQFSHNVNEKVCFALPPESFTRLPNEAMRAYATKVFEGNRKGKKKK